MDLRNRKVTIMGLGRHGGGVAAARYCALQGASVTVTDLADERALVESLAQLQESAIARFALGGHGEHDFHSADVVVVNPAVRPQNRFVQIAREAGAAITSEIEIFLNRCDAAVIGVTGTVGKSTTAAMLAAVLNASDRCTWLGGNIGQSLLEHLPEIRPDDFVVLELSSFQLYWLNDSARWPRAAIVTNCSPNHLDWHGTWESYRASKQRLVSNLPADGFAVLNLNDEEAIGWRRLCRAAIIDPTGLESLPNLRVPGEHNRANAACAAGMAKALGIDERTLAAALGQFTGLPHRLRLVAEIAGRQFFNDSKSTSPAATLAALAAMDRPTWLLLGGADQRADFSQLAAEIVRRAKGAALFGTVANRFAQSLREASSKFPHDCSETLSEALSWCWRNSHPGDAILLSPACASTDQFRDFAHRGEEFERLVHALA